jgi:hypothetical protein
VALKGFYLINCGPWSIFSLECGPPINLSLTILAIKLIVVSRMQLDLEELVTNLLVKMKGTYYIKHYVLTHKRFAPKGW